MRVMQKMPGMHSTELSSMDVRQAFASNTLWQSSMSLSMYIKERELVEQNYISSLQPPLPRHHRLRIATLQALFNSPWYIIARNCFVWQ